jgi:hypothetical protein
MIPFIVGLSSGLLLIAVLIILKQYDKQLVYGLILTGIGFLYIGFAWSDLSSLIVTSIQGLAFLILAYYGIKNSMHILALGYFLHGIWDLIYDVLDKPGLIPPHYDVFCLTIDFVIGIYLLVLARQSNSSIKIIANP